MVDSLMRSALEDKSHDSLLPLFLPLLKSPDYYIRPSLSEIASRECLDHGYCRRVPDFVIGKVDYGEVKFLGLTDVRHLDLDRIVKFGRHSVVVYEDEIDKPPVGYGLNKEAEVSLIIDFKEVEVGALVRKLKCVCEKQGARFISFDSINSEWKFWVPHFSRFGLVDDDDDDDDDDDVEEHEDDVMDEKMENPTEDINLSHSLPAHLGLDPVKMQEMRRLMFSGDDEHVDLEASTPVNHFLFSDSASSHSKLSIHRSSQKGSLQKASGKITPIKKVPVALLEYDVNSSEIQVSGNILLNRQTKGFPVKSVKIEGFKMDSKRETPLNGSYSSNIVDASLLMGLSFRVGWGPNGVLVHSGSPVCKPGSGLSSVIHLEKLALDSAAREENGKLKEDLIDLCFISPLKLHMSLDHEFKLIGSEPSQFRVQKVVADRLTHDDICRGFIDILEKKLEVPSLSTSSRIIFMHQVTVWELIRVLFSDRTINGHSPLLIDPEDDEMVLDRKDTPFDVDQVATHLIRRAHFSFWLQESVRHRVQDEVSSLNGSQNLMHILLLLTCRQLDVAVELAASSGDVRLAILLSQAGGSMVNRSDIARQLDLWRNNGFDFSFVETERLKLYELLAGNVHAAFHESKIDWKRYLGLIMWYNLPPDTPLPFIIHTYEQLVNEGKVPFPVPVYIDEGPLEELVSWNVGDRFDITYYLMLLHASEEGRFGDLKTMFSAFSSSPDPLDYHMIWHYKAILEAIGTFNAENFHLLDLSFASQLLSLGLYHWAIYVVLHMPYNEDFPQLQVNFIKEILFRYCEAWNAKAVQKQFILDLGVPSSWMDEALVRLFS